MSANMETEQLVRELADDASPVDRLAHPAWRTTAWGMLSVAYMALVVFVLGIRPDIAAKLQDDRFVLEVAAASLTGLMAAAGAFCSGCPGRPLWERFPPFVFLLAWLWSLGEGCWQQGIQNGAGLQFETDLTCLAAIVELGVMPAILMLVMIRRGAPLAPMSTTGLAILAATALAAAALRLSHPQDSSSVLLVWQFGTVVVLAGLGFLLGRYHLQWSIPYLPPLRERPRG